MLENASKMTENKPKTDKELIDIWNEIEGSWSDLTSEEKIRIIDLVK